MDMRDQGRAMREIDQRLSPLSRALLDVRIWQDAGDRDKELEAKAKAAEIAVNLGSELLDEWVRTPGVSV